MELSYAYNRILAKKNQFFLCLPSGKILEQQFAEEYLIALNEGAMDLSVYPGSWNPLHEGHRFIFDSIRVSNYETKVFEISLARFGKPELSCEDLAQRIQQFYGYAPVIVTAVPRFVEKAGVLSSFNCRWHVGVDTISRMRDDYGEIGISGLRGKFYVYDRQMKDNEPVQSFPLDFKIIPKNVFRAPNQPPKELLGCSSTKIRERRNG